MGRILGLVILLMSPNAFAAGANETLFTILTETGFAVVKSGSSEAVTVDNVYCEEKSVKKVKCTASQQGQMLRISDSRLFLNALRGQESFAKTIYTFKRLECVKRPAASGTPFYSCVVTP